MAEENKQHIKDESNVAPLDGAGALGVSYKNKMMRSVLYIDTHSKIGQGSGSIVGLPFQPPMLLTCNHVIPSKDVARDCLIYFDREDHKNPGVEVLGKDLFDLDGEDSFVTDERLDYTIITLNPKKIPDHETREPFLLRQYERMDEYHLKKNDNVYLVHYPRMDNSFVRRENSYIVQFINGYLFGHKAETQGGSSGCPVLKECRNKWVLVGVHRGTMPDKAGNPRINFATHVKAVHHTMLGKANPLGDPNWEAIRKEISDTDPKKEVDKKESTENGSDKRQPTPPKKDFMDCMPSDNGLQGIVNLLPLWHQYAFSLGIPADYIKLYMYQQPLGPVEAMKYWRDGRSGKKYPSTWRFLLEELESQNPADAAKLKEKVEENPRWTEWPDQK